MALRGARIAFTSEPDQAAKLRGGVLKRLASIDRMTGRALYGASMLASDVPLTNTPRSVICLSTAA